MGLIDKEIPIKQLEIDYTAAKIIANPYDYKISERVLFYDANDCQSKFNIFEKHCDSEKSLCIMLELDDAVYLRTYNKLGVSVSANDSIKDNSCQVRYAEIEHGYLGSMIKWNNLIINETGLWNDLKPYVGAIKLLKSKNYLKALEVWFLKSISDDSLIPNLFYLTTEFNKCSLEEMENIRFAEKAIADKKTPLILGFRSPDKEPLDDELLFNAAIIPSTTDIEEHFLKMGLAYSFVYGAELLYHLDNITDDTIKNALIELLTFEYKDDTFCSKYLYQINGMGDIEINPGIKACFSNNTKDRFESIRMLFDTVISAEFSNTITANLNYFNIPITFKRMLTNMHAYAYQVAKIKHATLLYKVAKEKGVLNKEYLTDTIDGSGMIGGPSLGTDEDDDDYNELIDITSFETTGESSLSAEKSIEKEKEVGKKQRERSSMLNAADMLKKDLYDSKYSFDVQYVKNSTSDKNAYNIIANNIKMITNELTKQIKEIKTYNTGGKQSGLLSGKLDKKNLWKYKTDPHIFYNNNYKLKEMDLAFGCILDESGSMYGEKIKNGRIVMIMLHEVLNSLGINHSIIGHTSSGMYQCKVFKYFQFKEEAHYSLDKPYGLIKADNRSGNCDSGSLYYMQSVMKSVRNKDKIVIIFSDGQPTECTDLDLVEQVRAMEKSCIHVIGVGINFESIKEYYPDNANGKNLAEMVKIVVSILKRYVLEKKED